MATPSSIPATDFDWYLHRRQGLLMGIDELQAQLQALQQQVFIPRSETILNLLKRLRYFGDEHFEFFYDAFSYQRLAESTDYSPAIVLSTALDQIAYDLEALGRAANQRILATGARAQTLEKADRLAWDVTKRFVKSGGMVEGREEAGNWSVLCYFQKSVSIRVLPYANVALIGIPMSCLKEPRDFLAIPHEVGHALYWKRKMNHLSGRLDRSYFEGGDEFTKPYLRWQEEIFADVFGCLVGRQAIAVAFQELGWQHQLPNFFKENDDHPFPILRPRIYTKILHTLGEVQVAETLDALWKERLELLKSQLSGNVKGYKRWRELIQAEIDDDVALEPSDTRPWDRIVFSAYEMLTRDGTDAFASGFDWAGAAKMAEPGMLPDRPLDTGFKVTVQSGVEDLPLPDELGSGGDDNLWDVWTEREFFFRGKSAKRHVLQSSEQIPSGTGEESGGVPAGNWIQVWWASGWTTEGPPHEPGG